MAFVRSLRNKQCLSDLLSTWLLWRTFMFCQWFFRSTPASSTALRRRVSIKSDYVTASLKKAELNAFNFKSYRLWSPSCSNDFKCLSLWDVWRRIIDLKSHDNQKKSLFRNSYANGTLHLATIAVVYSCEDQPAKHLVPWKGQARKMLKGHCYCLCLVCVVKLNDWWTYTEDELAWVSWLTAFNCVRGSGPALLHTSKTSAWRWLTSLTSEHVVRLNVVTCWFHRPGLNSADGVSTLQLQLSGTWWSRSRSWEQGTVCWVDLDTAKVKRAYGQ